MKITLKELELLVKNGFLPKIETPSGLEEITHTYRKTSPGKHIVFTDSSELKCSDNHLILVDGNWTNAKDLVINQKINESSLDSKSSPLNEKIIKSIEDLPSQEWVDFSIEADHHSYYHNGMTHHNSGKSAILFIVLTYIIKNHLAKKFLITVPTISLVHQLYTDFISYCSYSKIKDFFEQRVHCLSGGVEKLTSLPITISTNNSAVLLPNDYLETFDMIVSDEVHLMSKSNGQTILENSINTEYRIGLTGTLQESLLDTLVLEGLFGKPFQLVTTKQLIDKEQVANLKIYNIMLKYSDACAKLISKMTYQEEYEFVITNESRMKVLVDFISLLKKNTLVLFTRIASHGDIIFEELKKKCPEKMVIYLSGRNSSEEREASRVLTEERNDVIIIASFGIFAQGVSIRNLHNVVLASPYKSKIKILQSIGRGLRLHSEKVLCSVYDFVDVAKYKNKHNYLLSHFISRYALYQSEDFETTTINHPKEIILNQILKENVKEI